MQCQSGKCNQLSSIEGTPGSVSIDPSGPWLHRNIASLDSFHHPSSMEGLSSSVSIDPSNPWLY